VIARANTFISRARAASTVRAYRSDFADFVRWSKAHRLKSMPASPETIALYITDLASRPLAVATIVRRLTAISKAHAAGGFPSPSSTRNLVIGDTLRGIKRTLGTAPHRKDALLAADIRRLIAACPKNLLGLRDKALFLISFAGAFRRSESAGLNVEDLKYCHEGIVCNLRRSKTDQEGAGRKVRIPFGKSKTTCPVCALKLWLKKGKITSGRHSQAGRPPRGHACRESERSQFESGSCEPGSQERGAGIRDYEADRSQVQRSFGRIYKDGRNLHAQRGVGPGHLVLSPDLR
jgi:site-specific recombinase XerC